MATLAKPIQNTDGIVDGFIKATGSPKFAIKVAQVEFQLGVEVADVTGDKDLNRMYEHNGVSSGRFRLAGHALGDSAINLHNLQSFSNNNGNAASNQTTLTIRYGSGRIITGNIVIESIALNFSRTSAFAGLNISGRFTNTNFAAVAVEGG